MHLFFQIQNLQQLLIYIDGLEYLAQIGPNYVFLCFFFCNIITVNHFLYRFTIFLHLISSFSLTRSFLIPYAYVSIESIDSILLSSSGLKAILLIFSVKILCFPLLNLCWIFNINLLFFINSL